MKAHSAALAAALLLSTACGSKQAAPTTRQAPEDAPPTATSAKPAGFSQTLELQGITFRVECPNSSSLNMVRIVTSGLTADNSPQEREVDGTVSGAEVADINVDGSPEIYVYVKSAGSGSYGRLVAFSANKKHSLSEIYLPPIADEPRLRRGYMGHDSFTVIENNLVQRFPLYLDGDTNAQPSGKTRQLQYKLVPGEAGWKLRLDKMVEY